MDENKSGLYIVAIVAVIAVVALVVLVMSASSKNVVVQESENYESALVFDENGDVVGQAVQMYAWEGKCPYPYIPSKGRCVHYRDIAPMK